MDASAKRPGRFPCPVCAEIVAADVWAIIDAARHPDLAARIVDGTIHRIECPRGHAFRANTPLLVREPALVPPLVFAAAAGTSGDDDEHALIALLRSRIGDAAAGEIRRVHRALLPLLLRDAPMGSLLLAFVETSTWDEARSLVEQHPALLSDESITLLAAALDDARSLDAAGVVPALEECRDLLKRCRDAGFTRAFAELGAEPSIATLDIPPGLDDVVMRVAELSEHARDDVASMKLRIRLLREALERAPASGYEHFRASVLNDLGVIHAELAAAEPAERRVHIERAIRSHEQAIALYTTANDPNGRAITQFNLGNAHQAMAEPGSAGETACLLRAASCYEAALAGFSDRGTAAELARTRFNLGATCRRLMSLVPEERETYARHAIAMYEGALSFYAADDDDHGDAWHILGDLRRNLATGDRDHNLRQAIRCYEQALQGRVTGEAHALTRHNLGRAYADLLTGDRTKNLRHAIECFEKALVFYTPQTAAQQYVATQNNLGNAWAALPTGHRVENLRRAIGCFEAALAACPRETAPYSYALTQNNLGNAYRDLPLADGAANLHKAIESFEKALEIYTPESTPLEFVATQNNLGVTYSALRTGERTANLLRAIDCFQKALAVRPAETDPLNYARIQANLGNAYRDLPAGDRDVNQWRAIQCYGESLRFFSAENAPDDYGSTQNNLARAYYSLTAGDRDANLREAIACCDRALCVYTPQNDPLRYAGTIDFLGTIYSDLSRNDPVEHERNLRRALDFYAEALRHLDPAESPQEYSQVQHNAGAAYASVPAPAPEARTENLRRAMTCFEEALRFRDPASDPFGHADTHNSLGNVYAELPSASAAERRENVARALRCFDVALQFFTPDSEPLICRGIARNLANLRVDEADWRGAYAAYRRAIESAEALYRSALLPGTQQAEIGENASLYRGMVTVCVRLAGEPRYARDGLLYAEGGKARTFLDQIAQTEFPPPPGAPADLLSHEGALLSELRHAERTLASPGLSDELHREAAGRRKALRDELEGVWSSLAESGARGREYVALRRAQPPSWEELTRLADRLGPGTALVELYMLNGGIAAFVVRQGWEAPICLTLSIERDRLRHRYVGVYEQEVLNRSHFVRSGRQPTHSWLKLGESLLGPIERALGDARLVYFIPHDFLHLLPLHALTVGGQPFIARRAVAYAPSAAVLARTLERSEPHGDRGALVMGYTHRAHEQPLFHGEAEAVARLHGTEAIVGGNATCEKLRQAAGRAAVIHLSCHGRFNAADPLASAVRLADGELTARDWMGVQLEADLVTLSACETGFANVERGDEIVGLARALLFAGASSALLSLWSVNAVSTRDWMLDFYARAGNQDRALAFQQATLNAYADQRDPWHWAPFVLVGDWR